MLKVIAMKILFDLSATQPFQGNNIHGGGEYAKTVFFKLCEIIPPEISLEIFYNPTRNIDNKLIELCKNKFVQINTCINKSEISRLLCTKKYDVYYSALPYSYYDLTIPKETKFVYTIHGLRSLEYVEDKYEIKYHNFLLKKTIKHIAFSIFPFLFSWWKSRKIKNKILNLNKLFYLTENQTIITLCNHTKYSISLFFPNINISSIKLYYPPLKNYFSYEDFNLNNTKILDSLSLKENKYILLICGDRSEKGAYRACRILFDLMENYNNFPKDIKIIVLGASNNRHYQKLTKNNDRFIFHDYVTTEVLEILYKHAHLLLFPTLNEGFGIPPLEAMKYGVLSACSANSSMPEVYGESVLYFNPYDKTEMCIRILQSFDNTIREEKSIKMALQYKKIREKQESDLNSLINEIIRNGTTFYASC